MFPQNLGSPRLPGSHLSHFPILVRVPSRGRRIQLPGTTRVGRVTACEARAQLHGCAPPVIT